MLTSTPSASDIQEASLRIRPYIHQTPVLSCQALDRLFHTELFFKCENFQKAGSFKSRGACNAVFTLNETHSKAGVATHSSGNHAQALARAASLRNIAARLVMPENASPVKIAAVEEYGGKIIFCKPTLSAREETLARVISETGATEIHPYDNYDIIAGQATAAMEMINEMPVPPDIIVAPVGGGGLLSGTALAAFYSGRDIKVFGAEPLRANDAWQSFTSGRFVPSVNPDTIADGLRTSLGERTMPIIFRHVSGILTVSEESIAYCMKMIWERMKIVVETSSATALASVLEHPGIFSGNKTGIILSGGNADLSALPWK